MSPGFPEVRFRQCSQEFYLEILNASYNSNLHDSAGSSVPGLGSQVGFRLYPHTQTLTSSTTQVEGIQEDETEGN